MNESWIVILDHKILKVATIPLYGVLPFHIQYSDIGAKEKDSKTTNEITKENKKKNHGVNK